MLSLLFGSLLTLLGPWLFGWSLLECLLFFWAEALANSLLRLYWFRQPLRTWLAAWASLGLVLGSFPLIFWARGQALPSDMAAYAQLVWAQGLLWMLPLFVLALGLPLWLWHRREPLWFSAQLPLSLQIGLSPLGSLGTFLGLTSLWLSQAWGNISLQILPMVFIKICFDLSIFFYLKKRFFLD